MKKIISLMALVIAMLTVFPTTSVADPIDFTIGIIPIGGAGNPLPKSPEMAPKATLENHVLTFTSMHPAYTLRIVDANGDTVYQVAIPDNVSIIVLPSTLTGNYELQLFPGNGYYYYSDITL